MRYWWVNQNQTYRHEIGGGYLWSPKRNANGARNPFYESMREVAPGDLIFSFADTRIPAIGVARSYCWESPRPAEFGSVGQNWENIGWKVTVGFTELTHQLRPKDHIEILRPLLPAKYAPLQPNGNGIQSVYLTELPGPLAEVLLGLMGSEVAPIIAAAASTKPVIADDLEMWERKLAQQVAEDARVPTTEREAIIRARVGQGLFKERVARIETRCRITGVDNPVHLVASHCKPWRDSSNEERLNGENGLLLTPSIDHLFDRGFIGFEDGGRHQARQSLARCTHRRAPALDSPSRCCLSDLSPNFHPVVGRVRSAFEPVGLGGATGRGAEPQVARSAPPRCMPGALI